MMDLSGFNAAEVEPSEERSLISAGWYKIVFTNGEHKPTSAGTGSYLELVAEIIEGESQGRKMWVRLNLDNPNDTAVAIARRDLSGICRAIGVLTPKTSDDLLDKPLMAKIVIEKPSAKSIAAGYTSDRNEAKEYAPVDGAMSQEKEESSVPPWRRKK